MQIRKGPSCIHLNPLLTATHPSSHLPSVPYPYPSLHPHPSIQPPAIHPSIFHLCFTPTHIYTHPPIHSSTHPSTQKAGTAYQRRLMSRPRRQPHGHAHVRRGSSEALLIFGKCLKSTQGNHAERAPFPADLLESPPISPPPRPCRPLRNETAFRGLPNPSQAAG